MLEMMKKWLAGLGDYAMGNVLPAVFLFLGGVILIRIILSLVTAALEKSRLEKAAHTLIRSVIRVALYLLLILILASSLGIDVTGVVALASVLTLAVSLSVQTALTNVIGGFTLLSTKPFTAGDFVEIAGLSGTVREVGLTYTKLSTPDNKIISIPNSSVAAAQVVNYTVSGTRRITVNLTVPANVPAGQVIETLLEAGRVEKVLPDPAPVAALERYGENGVYYILNVWCKTEDYWDTLFRINRNVKDSFDRGQLPLSVPHVDVQVHS